MIYWHPNLHQELKIINRKLDHIMANIQDIQNAVAQQSSVEDSVITMLQNITQQLKDAQASNDPAAMDKVVSDLQANTKRLSDAVAANTPVASNPGATSTDQLQ
jgi:hypothetical protein